MTFKDVLIVLPSQNIEDLSLDRPADDAEELLTAWTAPFHPAIVSVAERTPRWVSAENIPDADTLEAAIVFLPKSSADMLPDGWLGEADKTGATVIRDLSDRDRAVANALSVLDIPPPGIDPDIAADFFALGYAQLAVELLTRQLRYMSSLDEEQFQRHVVGAAEAVIKGDAETTHDKLQSAFDLLTQAREYFYPHEASFIDLTLVASSTLGETLAQELRAKPAANLLLTAADLEIMARREPETFNMLKKSLADATAVLAGGEQNARPTALMPIEAILADLRLGLATFERLLGQAPKIFGRRRFGLSPLTPQIIKKMGFEAALHLLLDAGRFPRGNQSRILWEGAGGADVEALAREPLDASRPETFFSLPAKLGDAMDLDHGSTLVFAHWPGRVCRWYEDLKRTGNYAPVLGRFDDLNHYFEESYGAGYTERHKADEYRSAYLQQAVSAHEPDAVSRWVNYYQLRTAADALCGIDVLTSMISAEYKSKRDELAGLFLAIDDALDAGKGADEGLRRRIEELAAQAAGDFARRLPRTNLQRRPGRLVINPWSFSSTFMSVEPDRPHVRFEATAAAMGYFWLEGLNESEAVSRESITVANRRRSKLSMIFRRRRKGEKPDAPLAEENVLRNEFFQIGFDESTGAIRSIRDYRTRNNRLAQQVALRDSRMNPSPAGSGEDEEAAYSIMVADELAVSRCDKFLGEMLARGRLVDRQAKTVARYAQTTRVRRGSRVIELQIDVEPERLPCGNPWDCYYAARFAWRDSTAEIYRDVNSTTHATEAMRLESPRFVDIRSENFRTTVLSGGLPYHRLFSLRKLDTLLIVAGERCRRFRLGIGIDLPRPDAAAIEFLAPLPSVAETAAPPAAPSGWLFHIDVRNVAATAWETIAEEGRTAGFAARLLETEGRNTCFHLRCFRNVGRAETADFRGRERNDLAVNDDCITINIAAHEWLQLEARWDAGPPVSGEDEQAEADYFMDNPL